MVQYLWYIHVWFSLNIGHLAFNCLKSWTTLRLPSFFGTTKRVELYLDLLGCMIPTFNQLLICPSNRSLWASGIHNFLTYTGESSYHSILCSKFVAVPRSDLLLHILVHLGILILAVKKLIESLVMQQLTQSWVHWALLVFPHWGS